MEFIGPFVEYTRTNDDDIFGTTYTTCEQTFVSSVNRRFSAGKRENVNVTENNRIVFGFKLFWEEKPRNRICLTTPFVLYARLCESNFSESYEGKSMRKYHVGPLKIVMTCDIIWIALGIPLHI